jgi:arylsulfatase A-like enzyme
VVEEIDWSVGQVLDTLRREGLNNKTLVFFTSDNGPWLTQGEAGGSAGPLRDGKGSTWEGGMREPGIAWWPGHVPTGVVTGELACTMDLFTTASRLAGAKLPQDRVVDGMDIRPVLLGSGPSPRQVFFYYRGAQLYAARKGPYKVHYITQAAYGPEKPVKHDPPLLFHLSHDPSERFDIASVHPEVLADIAQEVEHHRATVLPVKSQLEETIKSR